MAKAKTEADMNVERWAHEGLPEEAIKGVERLANDEVPAKQTITVTITGANYQVDFDGIEADALPMKLRRAAQVIERQLMGA